MNRIILLLTIYVLFSQIVFSVEQVNVCVNINFEAKSSAIIKQFQDELPLSGNYIAYTRVPRGLIVSIAEEKFFRHNSTNLTDEGKALLNTLANILKNFSNDCAIESHTNEVLSGKSGYKDDWEICIHRANVITEYLIKCCNIKTDRLYPIGFGDIMPFNDNVSSAKFTDNRIDFVIFDYTAKR